MSTIVSPRARRLWIGLIVLGCLITSGAVMISAGSPDGIWVAWTHAAPAAPAATTPRHVRGASPVAEPRDSADAAMAAIENSIGVLGVADETALHEPLLAMRRAELEFQAGPAQVYVRQVAWRADQFAERLAALTIPARTRETLSLRLAAYQHGVQGMMDATLAARREQDTPADTAGRVEIAPAAELRDGVEASSWKSGLWVIVLSLAAGFALRAMFTPSGSENARITAAVEAASREVALSTGLAAEATADVAAMTERLRGLDQITRNLDRALRMAGDITGQTLTLAQIARLEADRAGSAGAGFQVVAKRCETLADWAARAAGELTQPAA